MFGQVLGSTGINSNNSGGSTGTIGGEIAGGKSRSAGFSSFGSTSNSNANANGRGNINTSSSTLLKDLLESANNLPKPGDVELGSIHLTLSELNRKSQQLRKKGEKESNFTKAHYLLASSGISAEDIESELNGINLPNAEAAQTNSMLESTNLENYLNSKKDEKVLSSIEQSLDAASRDFDSFINNKISIDWKARRDELRKSIGLKTGGHSSEDGFKSQISWNKTSSGNYKILRPLETKDTGSVRQVSREKFENYAKIVYSLNDARLANKPYPLLFNFEELNKLSSNLKSKQLSDVFRILIELVNEKYAKVSEEQSFYTEYTSGSLNRKIIANGRSYLEQQFFNYMDEIYTKDDNKSEFTPATNINKVTYFIHKVILKNNSEVLDKTLNVNGTPIWTLIFYLLRCGLYHEALELTSKNKELFDKFDKNFPVYLKKFVETENQTNLPLDLNERLRKEFNQQFSFINEQAENFDTYKYSIYKIIGKCDLSKKILPSSINLSIEDWLWFHLSIINEGDMNESNLILENYTLEALQKKIISLGPKKFNSSSSNPLYLKTLVLVGLNELAVQYCYEYINECDAVHLAIGLNYYGLMRVSSSVNKDELVVLDNSSSNFEINFSRLLGSYTRTFKISDPKVACQYLILIAMSKEGESNEEISKCHEALRELILISREFTMLLGELNKSNGSKIPGILEKQRALIKLPELNDYYHKIIEFSAVRCEQEGRVFDALWLYQLCQEFDTIVVLINKLLGEILATTELDKPLIQYGNYSNVNGGSEHIDTIDNNIILFSQHIIKIFKSNPTIFSQISPKARETAGLLLPIIDVRDLLIKKDWNQVLSKVSELQLLPLNPNDDLITVRKLSDRVKNGSLDDNLIKVIPSLLIVVMISISQLNYSLLTKKYQVAGNEEAELTNLKKVAKNCMVYAGMVQYKMLRETYSLLINLEASLQ